MNLQSITQEYRKLLLEVESKFVERIKAETKNFLQQTENQIMSEINSDQFDHLKVKSTRGRKKGSKNKTKLESYVEVQKPQQTQAIRPPKTFKVEQPKHQTKTASAR